MLIGSLVAKLRIPSFVVTLAFFLGFQGVGILISNWAKGPTGSIPINDKVISDFTSANLPTWAGWLMIAIIVAGYAFVKVSAAAGRRRQGLIGEPFSVMMVKVVALAVVSVLFVYVLNLNRRCTRRRSCTSSTGKLREGGLRQPCKVCRGWCRSCCASSSS